MKHVGFILLVGLITMSSQVSAVTKSRTFTVNTCEECNSQCGARYTHGTGTCTVTKGTTTIGDQVTVDGEITGSCSGSDAHDLSCSGEATVDTNEGGSYQCTCTINE